MSKANMWNWRERTVAKIADDEQNEQFDYFISQQCGGTAIDAKPKHRKWSEHTAGEKLRMGFALLLMGILGPWVVIFVTLISVGIWDRIWGN